MTAVKLLAVIGLTIGWIALTVNTIRRLIENNRKLRQLEKEIDERLTILVEEHQRLIELKEQRRARGGTEE